MKVNMPLNNKTIPNHYDVNNEQVINTFSSHTTLMTLQTRRLLSFSWGVVTNFISAILQTKLQVSQVLGCSFLTEENQYL